MPIRKVIQIGLSISLLASVIGFISALLLPEFIWGIIVAYAIYSFGAGLTLAPLNRLAIESVDAPMGARMAVFSTVIGIFFTLGSLLVTIFYNGSLISLALIILTVMTLSFIIWNKYCK